MEKRDSFIFYRSFYEALRQCPDDVRLQLYDAIADYALNVGSETPQLQGIGAALWLLIEPQLKANNVRYLNGKRGAEHGVKGAAYGKRGGAPKGNQNASKPRVNNPPNHPPNILNENENVNENVNDIEGTKSPKRAPARKTTAFKRPTLFELEQYIKEKGYTFSAETFYNYYESNGWRVGKNPMKNWKAACTTWQSKEGQPKTRGNGNGTPTNEDVVRNTYELIAAANTREDDGDTLPF